MTPWCQRWTQIGGSKSFMKMCTRDVLIKMKNELMIHETDMENSDIEYWG